MRRALLLALFFLVPRLAFGADAYCGLDTDHNGSITTCSNTVRSSRDDDRDGFTIAEGDCDDTNDRIYPGMATSSGCSANEAKNCPLSGTGTYTACSSGGWKPEGCTTAYYIATTGSNAASGAVGAPWLNQLNFTTYYNVGDRPATYHDPAAGECFIFRAGTYSTTYTYDASTMHVFFRAKSGTSGSPIQIVGFPGETVIFDPSTAVPPLAILQSNYWRVFGLQFSDTNGVGTYTGNNGAVNVSESTGVRVHGNLIYNIDGNQSGNLAGIHYNGTTDGQITNNTIYDVYDRTNSSGGTLSENNSGILDFNSSNLRIARNKILNSTTLKSNCIKKKHSNSNVTTRPEIDWNYCYKADGADGYSFGFSGSAYAHHNFCSDNNSGSYCLALRDFGGTTNFTLESVFEYNDFLSGGLNYRPSKEYTGLTTFDNFITRYNIIVDSRSSGDFLTVCANGSNAYHTDLITGGKMTWDHNCYDLPSLATFPVNIFGNNPGSASFCGSGTSNNDGTTYSTFAGWGETGATETAPNMDSNGVPQAAACTSMGRFAGAAPTPTPTPTPTATPSVSKKKGQQNYSLRKGM